MHIVSNPPGRGRQTLTEALLVFLFKNVLTSNIWCMFLSFSLFETYENEVRNDLHVI